MKRATGTFFLVLACGLAAAPARADLILMGSDYFKTTFALLDPVGTFHGVPIDPPNLGNADTIVQRQADCAVALNVPGASCTVPIELVALSLQSDTIPQIMIRESPTLQSAGQMTMTSNGSGPGGVNGTFDSFFDVWFELSLDGGNTWFPQAPKHLVSNGTAWTDVFPGGLAVAGPVGDLDANFHDGKAPNEFDFFPIGGFRELAPDVIHEVKQAPIPGTLPLLLAGIAAGMLVRRRRA